MSIDIHGELRHFCWDWDGLLIDESCQEIKSCSCAFTSYTEEQKQSIIAQAEEVMGKSRIELVILGRMIGTYSGCDIDNTVAFSFRDFEPIGGFDVPPSERLYVNYDTGILQVVDSDTVFDLVTLLIDLPRDEK